MIHHLFEDLKNNMLALDSDATLESARLIIDASSELDIIVRVYSTRVAIKPSTKALVFGFEKGGSYEIH